VIAPPQLGAEMPQVERRVNPYLVRQQRGNRFAQKAYVHDFPGAAAQIEFEQAFAGPDKNSAQPCLPPSAARKRLKHGNLVLGADRVAKSFPIANRPAIDIDGDVPAHASLMVQYVTAQPRICAARLRQSVSHRRRFDLHRRRWQEAAKRGSKRDNRHEQRP